MPQQSIAAAVITSNGRVLLVRRRIAEGILSWQFPAGAVESGETPSAAAVRETAEEVGLRVEATAVLGEREHPATGRHMTYVACTAHDGEEAVLLDTEELAELCWATLAELDTLIPSGLYAPVYECLRNALD